MIALKWLLLITNVIFAFIFLESTTGLALVNMVAALALMLDIYLSS